MKSMGMPMEPKKLDETHPLKERVNCLVFDLVSDGWLYRHVRDSMGWNRTFTFVERELKKDVMDAPE